MDDQFDKMKMCREKEILQLQLNKRLLLHKEYHHQTFPPENKLAIGTDSNSLEEQNRNKINNYHKQGKRVHSLKNYYEFLNLNNKVTESQLDLNKLIGNYNLTFSPNISDIENQKHKLQTIIGLQYIRKSLKGPSNEYIEKKKIILSPKISEKKCLFLDLDETLISFHSNKSDSEYIIKVDDSREKAALKFNIRPFCLYFLQGAAQFFDIYVFTASSSEYADVVRKILDPQNNIIKGILHRSCCMKTKSGLYIKDLRIIDNRNLKDIVIVDNFVHSFGLQLDNGIPIKPWTNDKSDEELKFLLDYLIELSKCDDIRVMNRNRFHLNTLQ